MKDIEVLQNSIANISSELCRFKNVFEKAISKLDFEEQSKYMSQFAWFSKKVTKAVEDAGLRIVSLEGQAYDTGMAVTPLNIDDFEVEDELKIVQMIEPIIMQEDTVLKTGTVLLGRI